MKGLEKFAPSFPITQNTIQDRRAQYSPLSPRNGAYLPQNGFLTNIISGVSHVIGPPDCLWHHEINSYLLRMEVLEERFPKLACQLLSYEAQKEH